MSLSLEGKKAIVAEVSAAVASAYSAVGAEYRGLTVGEMTKLRVEARKAGVYLRVVRNTLARRAVEGSEFECIRESLSGPVVLAFSQQDPGAAARVINDFSKENKNLVVKFVAIGGQLLDASQIKAVADLPTKEQAISQLMGLMKAPVEKLARTMSEVPGKLVRTVAAIRDQKEA